MAEDIKYPTLVRYLPGTNGRYKRALLAVIGSLALWISAKLQVPFYPVPMTMQTLVVLALGLTYGSRLGASSVLLYLAAGAIGLPVFAGTPEKGIGISYMIGPTGGYLAGYVVAAALCGWLSERGWDRRWATVTAAMLAGNAIIYVFGLLWLGVVLGWDKPILAWGLIPFIPGDILKLLLAVVLFTSTWRVVGKYIGTDRS